MKKSSWRNSMMSLLALWLALFLVGCFDAGDDGGSAATGVDSGSPVDVSENSGDETGPECGEGDMICDGECVDVSDDQQHCGRCHNPCDPPGPNTVARCEVGACIYECEDGWVDTEDDIATGCDLECEPTNGGVEVCDGRDNDCNGMIDDDATDAPTWYADVDGDSHGDPGDTIVACDQPDGYVDNADDCDDTDPDAFVEVVGYEDEDGDTWTIGGPQTFCTDGTLPDGYLADRSGEDCDDTDPDIYPGAEEVCDGVDNSCDGRVDHDAVDATIWYVDCDGDGFAADTTGSRTTCDEPQNPPNGCSHPDADWTDLRPSGGSTTDCDDNNADVFPDQTEWFAQPLVPNGIQIEDWDYDCSGAIDHRWEQTGAQCQTDTIGCDGSEGWTSTSLTSCGLEADYQNCEPVQDCSSGICVPGGCDDSVETRVQECR